MLFHLGFMPVKRGTVRTVNFEFLFTRTENIVAVCSILTPFFDEPISFLQICVSRETRGLALTSSRAACSIFSPQKV